MPPSPSAWSITWRAPASTLLDVGAAQPVAGSVAVQPRQPERLVGVDVPDAADQALVEEQPLHTGRTPTEAGHERGLVERRVERVSRDVGDLGGQVGAALRERQAAEHALVDEPQLGAVVGEPEPHPQVPFGGGGGRLHQHLAAHAEVAEQGVTGVQRQPQVLAAAAGVGEGAPGQPGDEVVGPGEVPSDRAGVQHLHCGDVPVQHVTREAATDDLDLGKLRHSGPSAGRGAGRSRRT